MYQDPAELDAISDEKLKRMAQSLEDMHATAPEMLTEEFLRNRYLRIEDWKVDGDVGVGEADQFQQKIVGRIRQIRGEKEEAVVEAPRIKTPEAEAGWVDAIFKSLDSLESKGLEEGLKAEQDPMLAQQKIILDALRRVPEGAGQVHPELSRRLGREVRLREKLELLVEARRRLHNRRIEVAQAAGDLIQLGSSSPGVAKELKITITDLRPIDWYVLFHTDEMFPESTNPEVKLDLEAGMGIWMRVGEAYGELPDDLLTDEERTVVQKENIPSYKNSLNRDEKMRELRGRIARKVGRKVEELAYGICSVSMLLEKWDKERVRIVGSKNQGRDLMFFDDKRREEYYSKLGPAGPHVTVGAYFAKQHQGEVAPQGVKDPDYEEEPKSDEQRERLRVLRRNRDDAVFIYSINNVAMGLLVGDLWETVTAKPQGNKEKLIDIARRSGWKNIPFFELGDGFYSGYFTYPLFMGQVILADLGKTGWDFKQDPLTNPGFWTERYRLINRLEAISPVFNTRDRKNPTDGRFIDKHLAKIRRKLVEGILWDGSHLAQAQRRDVLGIVFKRKGRFALSQVEEVLSAIESSGFLPRDEVSTLRERTRRYLYIEEEEERH